MDAYDQLIGQNIEGKYLLQEKVGQGGMACVFRGKHLLMDREVAIKLMLPQFSADPHFIERFQREARLASRLRSPHIVPIHDFGQTPEGIFYLVMDFVRGRPLSKAIREQGAFPATEALEYTRQIARALQAAHREGIVHRDLKPDNIVLSAPADGAPFIQVLDFGIARMVESAPETRDLTITGAMIGTPAYMSPEQYGLPDPDGNPLKPDTRSDLYSLGVVLYEMLSGKPPFRGKTLSEYLQKHTSEAPPPLASDFPREIQNLVAIALSKQPAERFQTADEIIAIISDILGVTDTAALSTGKTITGLHKRLRERRRDGRRMPLALAAVIFLMVTLVGWTGYRFYQNSETVLLRRLAAPNASEERDARDRLYQLALNGETDLIPRLTALARSDAPVSARFHAIAMLKLLKDPQADSLARSDSSPTIRELASLPSP